MRLMIVVKAPSIPELLILLDPVGLIKLPDSKDLIPACLVFK